MSPCFLCWHKTHSTKRKCVVGVRCTAKWKLLKSEFLMSMKYLFLNLCTLDVLGRLVLCGGDFVHCNVQPHPLLLPTRNKWHPHTVGSTKSISRCYLCPLGGILSLLRTTGLGGMDGALAASVSPLHKKTPQRSNEWIWFIKESPLRNTVAWPVKRFGLNFIYISAPFIRCVKQVKYSHE